MLMLLDTPDHLTADLTQVLTAVLPADGLILRPGHQRFDPYRSVLEVLGRANTYPTVAVGQLSLALAAPRGTPRSWQLDQQLRLATVLRWAAAHRAARYVFVSGLNDAQIGRSARLIGRFLPTLETSLLSLHPDSLTRWTRVVKDWFNETEYVDFHDKWARTKPQGIGYLKPSLILVGEELGHRSWAGLPFDGGPAARWLHRSLTLHGPSDLRHYLMNARAKDRWADDRELHWLIANDRDVPVVALGERAHDWLTGLKIAHHRAQHPQYAFRFRNGELDRYGAKLALIQAGQLPHARITP